MKKRQHQQGFAHWQGRLAQAGASLCFGVLAAIADGALAGETANYDFALPQTTEESDALKARAAALRDDADARYATAQDECYRKFLVNACLDDAKKVYKRANIEVRPMEQAVRDFERKQRQADADAREAKRAADAVSREQEQRQQAETYRAEEARRAAERERKIADKAAQAEAGRIKTAADEAERQKRDAERARHNAEREKKKAEREAARKAEAEADARAKTAATQAAEK